MKIICNTPTPGGAFPPIQTYPGDTCPDGYLVVPDIVDTSLFYAYNGFVTIITQDGFVTDFRVNDITKEIWENWKSSMTATVESSPDEDRDAMLIDLEFRLTCLELGL